MRLLIPLLVLAVVVDILFAWLSFPDLHEENGLQQQARPWRLAKQPKQSLPPISELTASGFWGKANGKQGQVLDVQSAKALAEAEAKIVRQRVRAIVKGANGKQVLFEVGKKFQHFNIGEKLPGTQWLLLAINDYSLILSKGAADSSPRELRLYGDNNLIELRATENVESSHLPTEAAKVGITES